MFLGAIMVAMFSTKFLLSVAVFVSLAACANALTRPVSVVVGKDDFQVLGSSVKTVDELIKLLAERKIASVDLHNSAGGDYERIGKVIYAMSRKGVKIEAIDGQAVRREHIAPAAE
jgi:hypothetical protein